MKLFVVVACLLASAWSRVPSYNDENQMKVWVYQYEGQVSSGIPTIDPQYSGIGLKSKIVVNQLSRNEFKMEMQQVEFSDFNRKFSGPFSKELKPIWYRPSQDLSKHLGKPIIFTMIDGTITNEQVQVDDQFWSINIKKAVVNLFNVNRPIVKQQLAEQTSQEQPMSPAIGQVVEEVWNKGVCPSLYEVYPIGQGSMTTVQLKKELKTTPYNQPEDLIQVSKTLYIDQCDKRPLIVDSTPAVEFCHECGSHNQNKFGESAKIRYVLSKDSLTIVMAVGEGETIVPNLGHHSAVVSSTQKLLLESTANVVEPQQAEVVEYQELSSLAYTVPTSIMQTMAYFQPLTASPSTENQTVDQPTPDIEHAFRQDYLMQHRGETAQSLELTPEARRQVVQLVKETIQKIGSEMVQVSQEQSQQQPPQTEKFCIKKLASYISYLASSELNQLYQTIKSAQYNSNAEKQAARKIYLDIVSMTGTAASVKFLKLLINNEDLKSFEAVDVLTGLPESVVLPNQQAIKELLSLCQATKVRQNHFLQSTVCIGLGQIIRRTCKAPAKVQLTPRPLLPYACKPENLNHTIDTLSAMLDAAQTNQEKAIYLQTLGHTGTLRALQKMKHFVLKPSVDHVLRTSAITALRHISHYYPQQVLQTVLPIYNNRRENEMVRIAASTVVLASKPSYGVLEKMAVDLTHETDNQVGSFVYTTLQSLANSSAPCLQQLSANVSRIIKLAGPFHYDRASSLRIISALKDVSSRVELLVDTEYVSSRKSALPRHVSTSFSSTSFGKLLNQIFEVRMTQQGIDQAILRKLMSSPVSLEKLPPFFKTIVEKARNSQQTPEKMEGEALLRLFERTLFAYFNEETSETQYRKFEAVVRHVQDLLVRNYTGAYVKIMLPERSDIFAPTLLGLPITSYHTTELRFAVSVKDLKVELEPSLPLLPFKGLKKANVSSSKIVPYFQYEKSEIIGVFHPHNLKQYSTGYFERTSLKAPFTVRFQFVNETNYLNLTIKPHQQAYFKHVALPFTSINDVQNIQKVHESEHTIPINSNQKPRKVDQEFGKHVFGVGIRVVAKTQNPWANLSSILMKSMKQPIEQLPGTLLKLTLNPSLYKQYLFLNLEQENPSRPVEFELATKENSQIKRVSNLMFEFRERGQTTKTNATTTVSLKLKGGSMERKVTVTRKSVQVVNGTHYLMNITRTPFTKYEAQQEQQNYIKEIRLNVTFERTDDVETENQESLYTPKPFIQLRRLVEVRNMRTVLISDKLDKIVEMKGELFEEIKQIDQLEQPWKALATEIKKRCQKEQQQLINHPSAPSAENQVQYSAQQSRICHLALRDQALVQKSQYKASQHVFPELKAALKPVQAYLKYILFPYMDLDLTNTQQNHRQNELTANFTTLVGIPVTSMNITTQKEAMKFNYVHHESKYINMLLTLPSKSQPLKYFQRLTVVPEHGVCKISGDTVRTFDHVEYPWVSSSCQYIAAQDLSPSQKFLVIVSKPSQNRQQKIVKILIGSRTVEIRPTSLPAWNSAAHPQVTVDGQPINFNQQSTETQTRDLSTQETELVVVLKNQRLYSKPTVEIKSQQLGLKVQSNGYEILIQAPKSRRGQVKGLCGDNNGEQMSEFQGSDECVFEKIENFIRSYRIETPQCPKEQLPLEPQCTKQQQRPTEQPQQQPQYGPNLIFRNLYESQGTQTCFSTKAQPKCPKESLPYKVQEHRVEFHCIQSETSMAKKLIQHALVMPLEVLINKSVDYTKTVMLPIECSQSL